MGRTAILAAAGIGTVSVGGLGAYHLLKDKPSTPFSGRINTNKRIILETSNDSHGAVWKAIEEEYKKNGNIKGISRDGEIQKNLKEYCRTNKNSTSNNESEFEQYKHYCTRENLMTKLSQDKKSWNNHKDVEKWKSSENTYKALGSNGGDLLIPKSPSGNINPNEVKVNEIISHCEEISLKPFINDQDVDYKRGDKWCTLTNE
nr:hypothetical protein [Mycoplasma haemocanis]